MSAFGSKADMTCCAAYIGSSLIEPRLNRYSALAGLGGRHEAARVYKSDSWIGSNAAGSARATDRAYAAHWRAYSRGCGQPRKQGSHRSVRAGPAGIGLD